MTTTPPREQLPPLPAPDLETHQFIDGTARSRPVWSYSTQAVEQIVSEALRAQAASVEAVALFDCAVKPRPLSYSLHDYHRAMSEGPLNFTWQDKPHRLVYDLIAALRYYATPGHIPADVSPPQAPPTMTKEQFGYALNCARAVDAANENARSLRLAAQQVIAAFGTSDKSLVALYEALKVDQSSPPQAPQAVVEALEAIAASWDGCTYDAPGETIDIGADLRRAFAALATKGQQA